MNNFTIQRVDIDYETGLLQAYAADSLGLTFSLGLTSIVLDENAPNAARMAFERHDWSGASQGAVYFERQGGGVELRPPQPTPNHTFNWQTKQWEDPRTLADFKEAQWSTIKQARTSAEYAGFTWDGSTFDSDAISQNRITGAVTLAQMSPEFTIGWVLANNSLRTLNQMDMLQVGGALGQHVAAIFAKAAGLRAQIEAATTREAVEAVVW
jgi:hypothetical protein